MGHYVPKKKQTLACSSGARMDKPCYGCAVQRAHYERMDRIQEQKGFRPEDKPPIGKGSRFSFAVTVMEKFYTTPVLDKDGNHRKTRAGAPIMRHTPAPFVKEKDRTGPTEFGRRMHWTMGMENLTQLISAAGPKLKHHCMNCADEMCAAALTCPNCESVVKLPEVISGEDLRIAVSNERTCSTCKESSIFVPKYMCECGKPKSGGSLLGFDLRIKKTPVGEKSSIIEIVGVRMPTHLNKANPQDVRDRLTSMVMEPLNLLEIFSPASLAMQKAWIGDDILQGISPEPRKTKATETESYSDSVNYNE